MFREFLISGLTELGYEVTGEAVTLAEAKALGKAGEADLILLDMDLPDGDGMEFINWQMERRPTTRVLVLTAHTRSYPVVKLKRSGVMGVLDKGATDREELKRAIESVSEWRTYFSERVESAFRNLVREPGAFYKILSPREENLLKYFGHGLSNGEIAIQLNISEATVQGHRRNVMAKVGVKSTPELIIWAIQNGFVLGPQINRLEPVESRPRA